MTHEKKKQNRETSDGDKPNGDKLDDQKPDADKPDADKLDDQKPDADKPDADKPDADKPDADKPDADKPDADKPDTDKPDADKPDADKPDADKPQINNPENSYSSPGQYRNLYLDSENDKRPENNYSKDPNQFTTKGNSKYSSWIIEELENLKDRYERKAEILTLEDQDLNNNIKAKMAGKRAEKDGERVYKYTTEIDELKIKIKDVQNELGDIEQELKEIKRELEQQKENSQRERYSRTKDGTSKSNSSEEVENITTQSLFADDDPIKNTILYVATFFPGLNPQDFKRVVSLLLMNQTKTILVKESITREEGKTQVKETQQEKQLTKIWQESFEKSDGYLSNCYLRVSRKNGIQGIYFTVPSLRNDFLTYVEEQQPLYLEEQLKKTQKLDLLLDTSDDVSRKAIDVAVKASIDYPNSYSEDWLIELLLKIAQEDERRINSLLIRLSNLIYRLQIEQDYDRSKDIAQNFLESLISIEKLMSPKNRSLAFDIVEYLMDKHLRSGTLGIQSAKQLLAWLKKLLDQGNRRPEEIDNKLQADVYSLLNKLLWKSGFSFYIYDFLGILKEWLPEKNIPPKDYSPSNSTALYLLFAYCDDTVLIWNKHTEVYGKWPSIYPLFAKFKNQGGNYASNRFKRELDLLFSWLFHSTSEKELAITNVFNNFKKNNEPFEQISRFIVEWLVILRGFDDGESKKEVDSLIEDMARSIILNTSRSLKSELSNSWTSLTEEYLDKGTKSNQSGDKESQKQFAARRKILRDFKKKFRALQKEIKVEK